MHKYATEKLFEIKDVFGASKYNKKLFFEAIRESFDFHYKNSAFYADICRQTSFSPSEIKSYEDIKKIPYVFIDVFKHYELLSVPKKEIIFTFTSSGTKGIKSQIMWDNVSLNRQTVMREMTMKALGLTSNISARYMVFSYDYSQSSGRGVSARGMSARGAAYAHHMYTSFAPEIEKYSALKIRKPGSDFSFDLKEAAAKLEEFAGKGDPVRIVGFPSFTYFTVKELMKKHKQLPLHPESVIINGGGWKMHTGQEISKQAYRRELSRFFGIPEGNIRDVFGMVEHGVPYISCSHGNFHEPLYSKILIRHPLTGKILPDGETGLLQFLTPYIRSMPTFSLLSSDLGFIRNDCGCGIKKPYFTVLRRGGTTLYKGCALTASELIK